MHSIHTPRILLTGALLLTVARVAFASPLDDGNAAYKRGDYAGAATAYTAAVSSTTGIEQAKAYYKLGLADDKLNKPSDALTAYQAAENSDPSLSFAKNPDAFRNKLSRDEGAGSAGSSASASSAGSSQEDPAAQALATTDVYVDALLASRVDALRLQDEAQASLRAYDKFAIYDQLPAWYQQKAKAEGLDSTSALGHYGHDLHKFLGLEHNGLIVVVMNGYGAGVSLTSDFLSSSQCEAIAARFAPRIAAGDISGGVFDMSDSFIAAINNAHQKLQDMQYLAWLVVILIIVAIFVVRSRRKKALMASMRAPIEALREQVGSAIEYVDGYLPTLARNNADTDHVKAYRQAAASRYEQATKIIERATEASDLSRAQGLLDKAQADTEQARRYLDRATGGTAAIPGDDAVRPQAPQAAEPAPGDDLNAIPRNERGVSFFSSRPAPISQLVPVTLNVNGVPRRVMATPAEAAEIQRGQVPPIRAFEVGGRMVPWYLYDSYDPYIDYYPLYNGGWGSALDGAIAGFIGAELIDSAFNRPYAGWQSPYGFAPGWDSWGGWDGYDPGYYGGDVMQAHDYTFQDQNQFGNQNNDGAAGFFGGGSGYDQSDYGNNSGGAGFFGGGDQS